MNLRFEKVMTEPVRMPINPHEQPLDTTTTKYRPITEQRNGRTYFKIKQ